MPKASRKRASPRKRPARAKAVPPKKPAGKSKAPPKKEAPRPSKPTPARPEAPTAVLPPRTGDARRHVLSLSFLRDGDEFMARMEMDSGQITELKNRSLDQLLTLVASELEDLLE